RIVAQPGTITGSIGVFSGKMLTGGLWDKLGVTWDEVHIGTNATMWTGLSDYTPSQRANLDGTLDRIYQDFTSKVAVARKLPKERVEEIARGRIWSGEDALARGLVDALGGYPEALRQVRSALGLPADAPIHLEQFPPARGLLGSLVARAVGPGDDANDEDPSVAAVRAGVEAVQAVTRSLRAIGLGEATISGLRGGPPLAAAGETRDRATGARLCDATSSPRTTSSFAARCGASSRRRSPRRWRTGTPAA